MSECKYYKLPGHIVFPWRYLMRKLTKTLIVISAVLLVAGIGAGSLLNHFYNQGVCINVTSFLKMNGHYIEDNSDSCTYNITPGEVKTTNFTLEYTNGGILPISFNKTEVDGINISFYVNGIKTDTLVMSSGVLYNVTTRVNCSRYLHSGQYVVNWGII